MAESIANLGCLRGNFDMNEQDMAMFLAYKALEYIIIAQKQK